LPVYIITFICSCTCIININKYIYVKTIKKKTALTTAVYAYIHRSGPCCFVDAPQMRSRSSPAPVPRSSCSRLPLLDSWTHATALLPPAPTKKPTTAVWPRAGWRLFFLNFLCTIVIFASATIVRTTYVVSWYTYNSYNNN